MNDRIIFAGDREIAVRVLDHIMGSGVRPLALLTSDASTASHAHALIERCAYLPPELVLQGKDAVGERAVEVLRELRPDFIIGIHFPLIIPKAMLRLPRLGVLNLHPAYLPYNRGWHTPSWAILDGTPAGATLHFMDDGVDTGDIVAQHRVDVSPGDTAHTLYARMLSAEFELFADAWPSLLDGTFTRTPQNPTAGTVHRKRDLAASGAQSLDLDAPTTARDLLRRLRALTTNRIDEAARFEAGGRFYRVQVRIEEER